MLVGATPRWPCRDLTPVTPSPPRTPERPAPPQDTVLATQPWDNQGSFLNRFNFKFAAQFTFRTLDGVFRKSRWNIFWIYFWNYNGNGNYSWNHLCAYAFYISFILYFMYQFNYLTLVIYFRVISIIWYRKYLQSMSIV